MPRLGAHTEPQESNPRSAFAGQTWWHRHRPHAQRQQTFLDKRKNEFHRSWGQVLAEKFIQGVAGQRPYIATSDDRPEVLQWDHKTQVIGPLDTSGLLFALKRVA